MKRYLILLLFTFQGLLAQVQFEARVSKNTLGLNERLRVDFIMNVDGDNFDQPSFDGFKLVAGPSQQISQSWVNGRSSFQKIYSYILQPAQKGSVIIKQAAIDAIGRYGGHSAGSPALMGNTRLSRTLEEHLEAFTGFADVTLFPTGWAAGYGIVRLLAGPTEHSLIDKPAAAEEEPGATEKPHAEATAPATIET